MEANEAPEKLYIDSREHWRKSWTAFTTKAKGDDIEYVRADAFIEKAQLFLTDKLKEIPIGFGYKKIKADCSLKEFIDEFIEYVKGE